MVFGAEPKLFGKKRCKAIFSKTKDFTNPLVASTALGFISTITPCVPVFTFLLLPFAMGEIGKTTVLTIAFGAGANIVFILLGVAMGFGVQNIHLRFKKAKKKIELASGILMIVFGLFYMLWPLGPYLFGWENDYYLLPSALDLMQFVGYLFGITI